jgi:hypothetical protein
MADKYFTRITPMQCALKAQAAIVAEPLVVGYATISKVLLKKAKGSNTFQTVVQAKMKPEAEGTTIMLTAGMDPIVFVFGCIFLGAFILIEVLFVIAALRVFQSFQFSAEDRRNWLFLFSPLIAAAAGVGLARLGRYMAREDDAFLTSLFVDAVDARARSKKPLG